MAPIQVALSFWSKQGFVATELALVLGYLAHRQSAGDTATASSSRFAPPLRRHLIDSLGGGMLRARPPLLVDRGGAARSCGGAGRQRYSPQPWRAARQACAWLERIGSQHPAAVGCGVEWKRLNPRWPSFTTHWENQQILRDMLVRSATNARRFTPEPAGSPPRPAWCQPPM